MRSKRLHHRVALVALVCAALFVPLTVDLSSASAFVPSATKWNHTALTYCFENGTPDIQGDGERVALRNAFAEWQRYSGLTFSEKLPWSFPQFQPCSSVADIAITWTAGNHGDGTPFDGRNGVVAHGFSPGTQFAGDIHFDEAEDWTTAIRTTAGQPLDLQAVATHEIGHAIGLLHSNDQFSVMKAGNAIQRSLASDDMEGVRSLYPSLVYKAHVQDVGWQSNVNEGQMAGTLGTGKRVEALEFQSKVGGWVQCEAHVQNKGWMPATPPLLPFSTATSCGTVGQGLRLEAVKLTLVGAPPGTSIRYGCRLAGTGWTGWKTSGEVCGTTGESRAMEYIRVEFVR